MKRADWLISGCCAAYIAAVLTPTGVYSGAWNLLSGSNAANWVQAIGSIAAILSGFVVAAWQSERTVREARSAELRSLEARLRAATAVVHGVETIVRGWSESLRAAPDVTVYARERESLRVGDYIHNAIKEIDIFQLEMPRVIDAVLATRSLLDAVDIALHRISSSVQANEVEFIAGAAQNIEAMRKEMAKIVEAVAREADRQRRIWPFSGGPDWNALKRAGAPR